MIEPSRQPSPSPTGEYTDLAGVSPPRGRGTRLNPGNRYETVRLHVLGEAIDDAIASGEHPSSGRQVTTQALPDRTRTIINRVDSPDLGFGWTINPYRGCEHGCIYCYARPTHELLGMSSGLDFETKIMVKHDAPALLRRELAHPDWHGESIMLSGVTDPYQPLERELKITRQLLAIMAECRQPVSIVTKSRLVTRDLDLLSKLAAHNAVSVAVSLTTLDPKLAQVMEPRASCPTDRLRAMRELSQAGVPVMVMTAPIIPGLNDREIPRLLKAASEAGATGAGWVLLRLPYQIKQMFLDWLQQHVPNHAARIERMIRDTRGGALYQSQWRVRQRGNGVWADQIAQTFRLFKRRYNLDGPLRSLSSAAFRRPSLDGHQLELFSGRS